MSADNFEQERAARDRQRVRELEAETARLRQCVRYLSKAIRLRDAHVAIELSTVEQTLICQFEDCDQEVHAAGLCQAHLEEGR